jgi:ribosome maturation factor RimP
MTHPLVPQILEIARPIARDLNLDIVDVVFQTNQNPPVLRVDISSHDGDTSLEHCEQMSRALDAELEESDAIPSAYILEVSSPGVSEILTSDRDFAAFQGFSVLVTTHEAFKGQQSWNGRLAQRDDEAVYINVRGRTVKIPRTIVAEVVLSEES